MAQIRRKVISTDKVLGVSFCGPQPLSLGVLWIVQTNTKDFFRKRARRCWGTCDDLWLAILLDPMPYFHTNILRSLCLRRCFSKIYREIRVRRNGKFKLYKVCSFLVKSHGPFTDLTKPLLPNKQNTKMRYISGVEKPGICANIKSKHHGYQQQIHHFVWGYCWWKSQTTPWDV